MVFDTVARTHELHKQVAAAFVRIDRRLAETCQVEQVADMMADDLVFQLKTFVWTESVKTSVDLDAPLDWFEAVKERFAPAWAKARWPVKYRRAQAELKAAFPEYRAPPNLGPCVKHYVVTSLRPKLA